MANEEKDSICVIDSPRWLFLDVVVKGVEGERDEFG